MPISDILSTLQYTTGLIKTWGQCRLPNGSTLAEALTLNGIPFWDAFAVELARIYMPAALTFNSDISQIIRPYLSRAKHTLRAFVHKRSTHGCSTWPVGQTILCLGFSDYMYRDVLQPVANLLAEHPDCRVVSLSDKSWHEANQSSCQNVLYQTVWQHWNQQVCRQISHLKQEVNLTKINLRASNYMLSIVSDVDQFMRRCLEHVLNLFFRVFLPFFIPQAIVARHILESHRPALIISPDVADPRTRIYTLLCRQMGIPCLEVQFGATGVEGIEWQFLTADKVAVWGENSKEAMLKHGITEGKIIITGSPRHDCLVNVPDAAVKEMRAKLGVPEKSVMVLLASAYQLKTYNDYSNPEILRSMKRAVFEAANNTPGIFLVVKPHPLENMRETSSFAGKNKKINFVSKKSDIRELTKICDVFVSFGSTATADALVAGKLVICPVFPEWIWSELFMNTGATLVPTSPQEVLETFRLVASGAHEGVKAKLETARQTFLSNLVYRTDGLATERVAKVSLDMAQIS